MARGKETQFLKELGNSFKDLGFFYYKIPDDMSSNSFTLPRPFDSFTCVHGLCVALEGKFMKEYKAFGMRDLRPSQIENLEAMEAGASQGLSYVVLNIRINADRDKGIAYANKLLFWRWSDFKKLGKETIKAKDLAGLASFKGSKERFEISGLIKDIMQYRIDKISENL